MNVNAAIIDQRLTKLAEELSGRFEDELNLHNFEQKKSLAFVFLCVKSLLELDEDETFDTLTEGGNDFGVDAIHIADESDGEFVVTIFQGKYVRNLEGDSNFPEGGVETAVRAVRYLFDPSASVIMNNRLQPKIADVRSRISDGYIPQVRVLLCNNGLKWNSIAQAGIDRQSYGGQVTWEHVNHDRLVSVMQSQKPVNDTLRMQGKAIVEDFDFSRILIGKVSVGEIAALIERHGDKLLERNIRRYLGLTGNRVNENIRSTLRDINERANFYFYNNGITLTCTRFDYNALQQSDYQAKIENLQIINGGQTSNTIYRVIRDMGLSNSENLDKAFVMIRLYQLPSERESLVQNITYATNSQNPVDLKDLKANDPIQVRLETDAQLLGYVYKRKRSDAVSSKSEEISSGTAAEAILSVIRKKPHQAKFFVREHFGKLYDDIFTEELTGAQMVIAVLLYRMAENLRKRPPDSAPQFLPYSACFLAMRMGEYLAQDVGTPLNTLTHRTFGSARDYITDVGDIYLANALADIGTAIQNLYGSSDQTLQRLAATFRRGDLIDELKLVPFSPIRAPLGAPSGSNT